MMNRATVTKAVAQWINTHNVSSQCQLCNFSFWEMTSGNHKARPVTNRSKVHQNMPFQNIFCPALKRPCGGILSSWFWMYAFIFLFHPSSSGIGAMSVFHLEFIQKMVTRYTSPTQGCQKRMVGPPPRTVAIQKRNGVKRARPVAMQ